MKYCSAGGTVTSSFESADKADAGVNPCGYAHLTSGNNRVEGWRKPLKLIAQVSSQNGSFGV